MKTEEFKKLLKPVKWVEQDESTFCLCYGNIYTDINVVSDYHDGTWWSVESDNWQFANYSGDFKTKEKAMVWTENNFIKQFKKYFK